MRRTLFNTTHKILLSLLLAAALLLCSCTAEKADDTPTDPLYNDEAFYPIDAIDPCVVEPDERGAMSPDDTEQYRRLMDTMLERGAEISLGDESRAEFLLDLLKQSPYYFFVESAEVDGGTVRFTYAYSAEEQESMRRFIDDEILKIANCKAEPGDNKLDVVLKIYFAMAHRLTYDDNREDNKELGSPLFDYPADEIYKALRDGTSLCYGFAYVMRYALLQRGIDCFCVYGECRAHDMGHEWLIFEYDGVYFNCDPAWDRAVSGYAKLVHFGKTDDERIGDTLAARPFEEYHEENFGAVKCTDGRFSIFRAIVRFSYIEGHRWFMEDRDDKQYVFDTEKFRFV